MEQAPVPSPLAIQLSPTPQDWLDPQTGVKIKHGTQPPWPGLAQQRLTNSVQIHHGFGQGPPLSSVCDGRFTNLPDASIRSPGRGEWGSSDSMTSVRGQPLHELAAPLSSQEWACGQTGEVAACTQFSSHTAHKE